VHKVSRLVDAGFRFRGTSLGATTKPLNFDVHAILEGFLPFGLRVQKLFFLDQKLAVVAGYVQNAVGIDAAQLGHFRSNVLEKVAVVAYDHACESTALQFRFEPLDSEQIEVIGGLVEQEHVRSLDQGLDNRQPLTPASRERRGFCLEINKAGPAKCFRQKIRAFRVRHRGLLHRIFGYVAYAAPRWELRFLRHVTQTGALAGGHIAGVGVDTTGQNSE